MHTYTIVFTQTYVKVHALTHLQFLPPFPFLLLRLLHRGGTGPRFRPPPPTRPSPTSTNTTLLIPSTSTASAAAAGLLLRLLLRLLLLLLMLPRFGILGTGGRGRA